MLRIIQDLLTLVKPQPIASPLATVLARYESAHEKLVLYAAWDSLQVKFGSSAGWEPETVKLKYPNESGSIKVELTFAGVKPPARKAEVMVTLSRVGDGLYPVEAQWRLFPDESVVCDSFGQRRSQDLHEAVY